MAVMLKSDKRARAKPCLRCGYSLRHIPSDRCPECGLPAYITLSGIDSLEMSNPVWLRRLSLACCLLVLPYAIEFALQWLRVRILLYELAGWRSFAVVTLGCAVLHQSTMLMLCWPEGRYPDKLALWRIAAWIMSIAIVADAAADAVFQIDYAIMQASHDLYTIWQFVAGILYLANAALVWAILRALARRLSGRRLLSAVNFVLILFAICAISHTCGFPGDHAGAWWAKLACVVVAIINLTRLSWAFRKAAISAEREWGTLEEA